MRPTDLARDRRSRFDGGAAPGRKREESLAVIPAANPECLCCKTMGRDWCVCKGEVCPACRRCEAHCSCITKPLRVEQRPAEASPVDANAAPPAARPLDVDPEAGCLRQPDHV